MEELVQQILKAVSYIKSIVPFKPDIAVVLGEKLGSLAYEVQNPIEIPFEEIPYFKTSYFSGSKDKLVFGKIYNKKVVIMQGGLHYFEGFSMQDIAFPIRVFAFLGVSSLMITCSGGAISSKFQAGGLAVVTDHINMSFDSPLRGPNDSILGARFPMMKNCYTRGLIDIAKSVAQEIGFSLQEGVYAFMPGPQYETNAEINMLANMGADIVGMSMVPEVIVAVQSGMDVLGVVNIANSAGVRDESPERNVVLDGGATMEENFRLLIMDTINRIETEG